MHHMAGFFVLTIGVWYSSSNRPYKGRATIFIPVYSTGCSKCVSMELELQRAVRRCSEITIDTIVNYVSVDRHSQYSSLKFSGQIPVGAVPDVGHRFERLIGSRPSLAVVVIIVDQRKRYAPMNAEDICRQLQSLSKEP